VRGAAENLIRVGIHILIHYIMKTRFFKFVLPVFAILLAVSFAFATETKPMSQPAYYLHPISGWIEVTVGMECQPQAGVNCTYDDFQLYKDESTSFPLRKVAP